MARRYMTLGGHHLKDEAGREVERFRYIYRKIEQHGELVDIRLALITTGQTYIFLASRKDVFFVQRYGRESDSDRREVLHFLQIDRGQFETLMRKASNAGDVKVSTVIGTLMSAFGKAADPVISDLRRWYSYQKPVAPIKLIGEENTAFVNHMRLVEAEEKRLAEVRRKADEIRLENEKRLAVEIADRRTFYSADEEAGMF